MKEDKEKEVNTTEEVKDQVEATEEQMNEGEVEQKEGEEVNEWQKKHEELNDKYLRLYSDFENFRVRTQKEKVALYSTAGERVLKSFLPVLDDFERALKAMHDATEVKSVIEGVELIQTKFFQALEKEGMKKIDSQIGEVFNIELHEAITQIPASSEDMKGKVMDEVETGYKLNDKVLRYTKVVVGQ